MTGTVIFFSAPKGWGFIKRDDDQPDLFVHFSALTMDGYRKLEAEQKVSFDIEKGPKGREQACNVVVVD
jgi:CspA family cold shock protein